jgi:hypothetical protein
MLDSGAACCTGCPCFFWSRKVNVVNFNDPSIIAAVFLAGAFCVGALLIVVVLPALAHFSLAVEAISLFVDGLGHYFGQSRLVWLACGVVMLGCIGCCVITIAIGGSLITCNTTTPSQLCRLIGR